MLVVIQKRQLGPVQSRGTVKDGVKHGLPIHQRRGCHVNLRFEGGIRRPRAQLH